LLKPAARALASLLWALKQTSVDMAALSGAQHLAASGRTSFPVDKALPRDAYRVLGYRQCGERAVRVDILERLADLIRPALAWRETSPGEKPPGAFDGRGFVVTQAMTSLTGSAGEDFASVLRALGYRMERRRPLPPKPPAVETAASGEAASSVEISPEPETPTDAAAGEVATADISPDPRPDLEEVVSALLLPAVDFAQSPEISETAAESPPSVASVEAAPDEAAPQTEAATETVTYAALGEAPVAPDSAQAAPEAVVASEVAPAEASSAAAAPPAEPELVEVWRPGGRSDERRPRHERKGHRRHERPAAGASAAVAGAGEAAAGEAGEGAKRERHRHRRRDRHHDSRKTHPDQPAPPAASAEGAPVADVREERSGRPRERFEGKGRSEERNRGKSRDRDEGREAGRDKHRDRSGRDRDRSGRESGPSHRQYATSASPRDRDRAVDPNSPFAKLAALKEQLSAARKD